MIAIGAAIFLPAGWEAAPLGAPVQAGSSVSCASLQPLPPFGHAAPNHDDDASTMAYLELPLEQLDGTKVEAIWRYEADLFASGEQLVLPDGRMDLVAHCTVRPNGKIASVWLVIAGPADRPMRAAFRSHTVILGVRFHLGWGGACLGVEPAALRNRTISAGGLEQLSTPLAQAVLRSKTLPDVESALRSVVCALVMSAPADGPHRMALDAIALMKGQVRLGMRLRDPGANPSSRTLRRTVVAIAGFPLRTLTGILRFQEAMAILQTGALSLSEVALAAGYTDQSHMTRAFRRFGGFTPSLPEAAPLVRLAPQPI